MRPNLPSDFDILGPRTLLALTAGWVMVGLFAGSGTWLAALWEGNSTDLRTAYVPLIVAGLCWVPITVWAVVLTRRSPLVWPLTWRGAAPYLASALAVSFVMNAEWVLVMAVAGAAPAGDAVVSVAANGLRWMHVNVAVFVVLVVAAHRIGLPGNVPQTSFRQSLRAESRGRTRLLPVAAIDWIAGAGDYSTVHTEGQEFLVNERLKNLEADLNPQVFVRIHRSTIVNAARIVELRSLGHGDREVSLECGTVLRVARRRWQVLERAMGRTSAVLLAIVLATVGLASASPAMQEIWPTEGWTPATPQEVGLNAAPLRELDAAIRSGRYGHVDRLVVAKQGYLVVDESYDVDYRVISKGKVGPLGCGWESCNTEDDLHDFNYLHPDYHPWYQGRAVHSLQSVTKSVSATVLAAAIHNGAIAGVQQPLLGFLVDYDLSRVDPRLREATLADLLTMRSGIEWHEQDRPMGDTNTTIQLEHADDWVQFTLDQPMDSAPGTRWAYNSGGSHLMSAVVRAATGQTIAQYAEEHLFAPLGIDDYYWKMTPRGLPDTEGGLYLEARDLAKIGHLMLRDGNWDGQRLLPEGWARAASARQVERVNGAGWGYGYQWWRTDTRDTEIWAGLGFGDQYLLVLPEHDLVAVANSWNLFDRPDASILRGLINAVLTAID